MGFKELLENWYHKTKSKDEGFKALEKEYLDKKRLEEKYKTPHQKEIEFMQRERDRAALKRKVEFERKQREIKLKHLSDPFKPSPIHNGNELMRAPNIFH